MAKKDKYISQEEIEYIEHCLYNGIPYETVPKSRFHKENLEKILLKGEKYTQLENPNLDIYAITSYGRCINTKRILVKKIKFSGSTIVLYIDGLKVNVVELFEKQGWKYNFKKILKRYQENNWPHYPAEYGRQYNIKKVC